MTETMSVEEFLRGDVRSPVGWSAWLRELPCMVPTTVPEDILARVKGSASIAQRVSQAGISAGVPVKVRTIDGKVWVLRLEAPAK